MALPPRSVITSVWVLCRWRWTQRCGEAWQMSLVGWAPGREEQVPVEREVVTPPCSIDPCYTYVVLGDFVVKVSELYTSTSQRSSVFTRKQKSKSRFLLLLLRWHTCALDYQLRAWSSELSLLFLPLVAPTNTPSPLLLTTFTTRNV